MSELIRGPSNRTSYGVLGFRDLGLSVSCFRVLEFRVLGFGVLGFQAQALGFRAQSFGLNICAGSPKPKFGVRARSSWE